MAVTHKPFSEACEKNKDPILEVLQGIFTQEGIVLEIGSGTGQHAVHFTKHMTHLTWQPTDLAKFMPIIELWRAEANLPNVNAPLELDVTRQPWPITQADGVFSANTAHIMPWPVVEALFQGVGQVLQPRCCFCLYGPFSYGRRHTSSSNDRFDVMLRMRDPEQGIRDFNDLDKLAQKAGLALVKDYRMPANNRTLVWRKARH